MFGRPPPRTNQPVTLADALTLGLRLGLGRPGKRAWGKAKDIDDVLARAGKLPFGRALINAANGPTLPHAKTITKYVEFLVDREGDHGPQWATFLEDAYSHSQTLGSEERQRDDRLVKVLLELARTASPHAIRFPAHSHLTDYLEIRPGEESDVALRRLVLDSPVTLAYVKAGLYMPRPAIERAGAKALETFLFDNADAAGPVVFWLDGRSGDGKSAILFRLPLHFESSSHHYIHIGRLETLADFDVFDHALANKRLVLVVDDLAKLLVEEKQHNVLLTKFADWKLAISNGHLRSISVLTCGPTPEMEYFRSKFKNVDIGHFTVPPLAKADHRAFAEWFGYRDIKAAGQNSEHLVEFLFVMREGVSLSQFAASFRSRISGVFGVFELVYRIMVASSLDLPTPLLSTSASERNALDRLAAPDQKHFWFEDGRQAAGIFFSHNAISKTILREWMADPRYRTRTEELAAALASLLGPINDERYTFRVVERLRLHRRHADEICEGPVSIIELLRFVQDSLSPGSLAWLATGSALASEIAMSQDASYAASYLDTVKLENALQPAYGVTSAVYLAKIAELAQLSRLPQFDALREQCVNAVVGGDLVSNAGYAVGHLVARNVAPQEVIEKWMVMNPRAPRPPELICASAFTPITLNEARDWLAEHGQTQRSVMVAAWLIQHAPNIEEALDRVRGWLDANLGLNGQYSILAQLINRFPVSKALRDFTLNWFAQNRLSPGANQVLAQLVRKEPYSPALGRAVLGFTKVCQARFGTTVALRNRIGPIIESAINGWSRRRNVLWSCSTAFIRAFPDSDHANNLFSALLKYSRQRLDLNHRTELSSLSTLLIDAGINELFMVSHLPTHLRFAPRDRIRIERAYRWLETSPFRSKGGNVVTILLGLRLDADRAWTWLEEFGHQKGLHTVFLKFFQCCHTKKRDRDRVFSWIAAERDRVEAQQVWNNIYKNYPQYRHEIGPDRGPQNSSSLAFNEIDHARHRFQTQPTLANAEALTHLIRNNPATRSTIGAVAALLKEEIEGFDPFEAAQMVIRQNLGNVSATVIVTKVINKFDLDPEFAAEIRGWIYLHREAPGIAVPLLACLNRRILDIKADGPWILDEMIARPKAFGKGGWRIMGHLAKVVESQQLDVQKFKRLLATPDLLGHVERNGPPSPRLVQDPDRASDLSGMLTSSEELPLWKFILQWGDAPVSVQDSFYSWCNAVNRVGSAPMVVVEMLQALPPPWLDLQRINEPLRSSITSP